MSATDRELLELAAKAAGVKYEYAYDGVCVIFDAAGRNYSHEWNPLIDGGEALRLAVKLRLNICPMIETHKTIRIWEAQNPSDGGWDNEIEGDEMAAVCRAIVRAAAEIGKAMP